jgi:hypothetical protein
MPHQHHTHPEPEERSDDTLALTWKPKFPAQFEASPPAWKPLIARCKEMQQALSISDNAFTGPLFAGSAWNQLCNGKYRVPTKQGGIDSIRDNLLALVDRAKELLEKKAAGRKPVSVVDQFVMREEYTAVTDYLEDAAKNIEDKNEERIVFVLGETRQGKSSIIAKLKAENKVHWHLKATPAMKKSYKEFLAGIALALNLRDVKESTGAKLQKAILGKLDKVTGVLAIEELKSFSNDALEFLKMLLNDTQLCLVVCMLPGQYRHIRKCRGEDSEDRQQFLGRSVGVVNLEVTPKLVGQYNPTLWKRCPDAGKLQQIIAEEAVKGGGMSLVRDVCRDALLLAGADGVKPHHISDALTDFRRKIPAMERRAA